MEAVFDVGKRAAIMSHPLTDNTARLEVLEARFTVVERGQEAILKKLDTFAQRPNPIPFKEILTAVVMTLGIVATLATFANYWLSQANAVSNYRLEQLEKKTAAPPLVRILPAAPPSQ